MKILGALQLCSFGQVDFCLIFMDFKYKYASTQLIMHGFRILSLLKMAEVVHSWMKTQVPFFQWFFAQCNVHTIDNIVFKDIIQVLHILLWYTTKRCAMTRKCLNAQSVK